MPLYPPATVSGYYPGGPDVAVADGGTNASTASGARANLGLAIGTDIPGLVSGVIPIAELATGTPTGTKFVRDDGTLAVPPGGGGGGGGGTGGGALTLLEQHTAANVAQLDFTAFISSAYDDYLIEIVSVIPVTDGTDLQVEVGTGGGPTFDTTGANYSSQNTGAKNDGSGLVLVQNPGIPTICSAISNVVDYGGAQVRLQLQLPQSTTQRRNMSGNGQHVRTTGGLHVYTAMIGIQYTALGTALTALRFKMSSGNIASGTIRIYGIANSSSAGMGGGTLTLLEQHAASSSAELDFTSFISPDYDEYLIEGLYLVPATDGAALVMQVGTGGGPTYDTGSNYFDFGGSAATSLSIAPAVTNAAGYGHCSFSLRLNDPSGAKMKSSHGTAQWHNGSLVQGALKGGLWASTTAATALRFLFSSGNITAGIVRIYGIAKVNTGSGGGGGLTLLEQHTASGSAQLDFTSFISAAYDQYLFELVNVVPATNDVGLRMRLGTGGGPTYDTGTNYGWSALVSRAGGTLPAPAGSEGGATFIQLEYGSSGTTGISNSGAWGGVSGSFRLYDPQSATQYKFIEGQTRYLDAEPFRLLNQIAGTWESTAVATAVRFFMSSGNIASGTIRVYGIAKS